MKRKGTGDYLEIRPSDLASSHQSPLPLLYFCPPKEPCFPLEPPSSGPGELSPLSLGPSHNLNVAVVNFVEPSWNSIQHLLVLPREMLFTHRIPLRSLYLPLHSSECIRPTDLEQEHFLR